jgi:triacylglycerol lipase
VFTPARAAQLGLLVNYAMDMYRGDRENLTPAPDARLAPDWRLLGYLASSDCLFRRGQTLALGDPVCFGYLAQNVAEPSQYIATLRGTDGIIEWIEDAEFLPIAHPAGGKVEEGFYDLYSDMRYLSAAPAGSDPAQAPFAAAGIAAAVGTGTLTVIGHSLGAAMATYLSYDLAAPDALDTRVATCLLASPRPGDAAFVKAFATRVKAAQAFAYELDIVPRVPLGPDYTDLLSLNWIGINTAQAKICFSLPCHHHVLSYCSMLDWALTDWRKALAVDAPFVACIKGPAS